MRTPDSWHAVMMEIAQTIAKRSKDPSTQIGAVITDRRHAILGIGYNGPPRCFHDASLPWNRPEKYDWVIHAEENAMWHAVEAFGRSYNLGATLYTTGIPCRKCALLCAHIGIEEVIYGDANPIICDLESRAVTFEIFKKAEIRVRTIAECVN